MEKPTHKRRWSMQSVLDVDDMAKLVIGYKRPKVPLEYHPQPDTLMEIIRYVTLSVRKELDAEADQLYWRHAPQYVMKFPVEIWRAFFTNMPTPKHDVMDLSVDGKDQLEAFRAPTYFVQRSAINRSTLVEYDNPYFDMMLQLKECDKYESSLQSQLMAACEGCPVEVQERVQFWHPMTVYGIQIWVPRRFTREWGYTARNFTFDAEDYRDHSLVGTLSLDKESHEDLQAIIEGMRGRVLNSKTGKYEYPTVHGGYPFFKSPTVTFKDNHQTVKVLRREIDDNSGWRNTESLWKETERLLELTPEQYAKDIMERVNETHDCPDEELKELMEATNSNGGKGSFVHRLSVTIINKELLMQDLITKTADIRSVLDGGHARFFDNTAKLFLPPTYGFKTRSSVMLETGSYDPEKHQRIWVEAEPARDYCQSHYTEYNGQERRCFFRYEQGLWEVTKPWVFLNRCHCHGEVIDS
jgi:hypothetical protein